MVIVCSLYDHCMFIVCSLYVHYMIIVCSLYVHCTYITQKRNEDSLLSHKLLKLLQEVEDGVYHSFEERVLMDIVAIVCVTVETTCNKHLRSSLPLNGSLFERYKSIRKLILQGQLYIS